MLKLENTINRLEQFGHRGSATANELAAGEWLRDQLENIGIPTKLEPFRGSNSYGTRILVHLVSGATSWALVMFSPVVSLIASLLTLLSFFLETLAIPRGATSLFSSGKSQNVIGRIPAKQARKRIVVCAHVDTQRSGWIWQTGRMKNFVSGLGKAPGPFKAPLFSVTIVLAIQSGIGAWACLSTSLSVPVWLLAAIGLFYAVGIVVVGQWSVAPFVPGANDNATGVAVALELASRWKNRWSKELNEDTELIVLLTGCEESGSRGAAAWARHCQNEESSPPTVFLNLDTLGCSNLRFIAHECALNGAILPYPESLLNQCEGLAQEMGLMFTHPQSIPTQTDGLAFLVRGFPGITLISNEDEGFIPHYHQMSDRAEYLNFDTIRLAVEFGWKILCEFEKTTEVLETN